MSQNRGLDEGIETQSWAEIMCCDLEVGVSCFEN